MSSHDPYDENKERILSIIFKVLGYIVLSFLIAAMIAYGIWFFKS